MRPYNLKTKIFLDSGDPDETREAIRLLGFLDGQTTNPTLIAKNPDAAKRLECGEKFLEQEILDFYKKTVQEISRLIPEGSVSIEVYADNSTPGLPEDSTSPALRPPQADSPRQGRRETGSGPASVGGLGGRSMLEQAREFYTWIGNAHIKFPTNIEGLKAAEAAVKEGMRVNMTLCFSQEQAAAVHAATRGAKKGQVFVSPFVGRLDDIGENGMDLIKNIIEMYREVRSHVEVLTASVRSVEHLLYGIKLGSDIITMPLKVLKEWVFSSSPPQSMGREQGRGLKPQKNDLSSDSSPSPGEEGLKSIPYKQLDLNKSWRELYKEHELTVKGMEKFSEDWNKLIK